MKVVCVRHRTGGGVGILLPSRRVFVGSRKWWTVVSWGGAWSAVLDPPSEELWAAYVAATVTKGELR